LIETSQRVPPRLAKKLVEPAGMDASGSEFRAATIASAETPQPAGVPSSVRLSEASTRAGFMARSARLTIF